MPKKNIIRRAASAVSVLTVLACLSMVVIFFTNRELYDHDGPNIKNSDDLIVHDAVMEHITELTQSFTARSGSATNFSVLVKNTQQPTALTIELRDKTGKSIFTGAATIGVSNFLQSIPLNAALVGLPRSSYQFTISVPGTPGLSFITVPGDRYENGQLYLNNRLTNEVLVFDFWYRTEHLASLAAQRLTYYKPWFFQHPTTFLTLFGFFCLSIATLAYYLVQDFFSDPRGDVVVTAATRAARAAPSVSSAPKQKY